MCCSQPISPSYTIPIMRTGREERTQGINYKLCSQVNWDCHNIAQLMNIEFDCCLYCLTLRKSLSLILCKNLSTSSPLFLVVSVIIWVIHICVINQIWSILFSFLMYSIKWWSITNNKACQLRRLTSLWLWCKNDNRLCYPSAPSQWHLDRSTYKQW